jgi:chromosome segregation ATPase
MSKLRNFFGVKPSAQTVENKSDIELDDELYLTIARQLGKENESIRNLLVDAEQKLKELDSIKRAIAEQVDPVSKTLRVLEETKSALGAALTKIETLESEGAQLRDDLAKTRQNLTTLESTHAAQTKDLAACRVQITELKDRVQKQNGEIQTMREENRRLNERVALADRQKAQLDSELAATRTQLESTRQKLTVSETERTTALKSLELATAELSQMGQRLRDADKAFEDAKRKYDSDIALHEMNYEALRTRADLTHKLLEETRKGMLERANEIGSSIAA